MILAAPSFASKCRIATASLPLWMGFAITEDAETVELGTAVKTKMLRARGMVRWLDRTIQVEALISDEPMPVSGRDTARALVGTEMLANCLLLVDFVARAVEIEERGSDRWPISASSRSR